MAEDIKLPNGVTIYHGARKWTKKAPIHLVPKKLHPPVKPATSPKPSADKAEK